MAVHTVTNWFGDIEFHPRAVVEVESVADIASVLRDTGRYPSPVRPAGSRHSTTRCGVAEGGTLIDMRRMNRIVDVGDDYITAEAGALYIDAGDELHRRGRQFHVNTEIGNLTFGAAACAGTKDASMPGEHGQVNSYVSAVRMITPARELVHVTEEDDPELMRMIRSSYGLLGIVYEVTLRTRPTRPMAVRHESYGLDDFATALPALRERDESLMLYLFPFDDSVTVECRRYVDTASGEPDGHVWALRNFAWKTTTPRFCHEVEESIDNPAVRYKVIDGFLSTLRFKLATLIKSDHTIAHEQTIRYPEKSDESRYTFSLWAFPAERYGEVLQAYFDFCRRYYAKQGYRTNMPNVGYRIFRDDSAWFSYAPDGMVITIDPVSTGNPGWPQFLDAYNAFCSERGGRPLFNQTPGITAAQARAAFGDRLDAFERRRRELDPQDRLLNPYFRELLGG